MGEQPELSQSWSSECLSPGLQSSQWALCTSRAVYSVHWLFALVCCGSLLGV